MTVTKGIGLVVLGIALGVGGMWSAGSLRSSNSESTTATPLPAPAATQMVQGEFLDARTKGDPNAPITIIEASDFQCPYCRVFWEETLPLLEQEYVNTGKARLVFLHLPLPQLHANAPAAHEFAMCAAMQGRFWPVHDALFEYQTGWAGLTEPGPYFRQLADSAGVDTDLLERCFETGAARQLVRQEAERTFGSGIRSTPSFVIEGGLLPGAHPIETWRPILDSIFEAKR